MAKENNKNTNMHTRNKDTGRSLSRREDMTLRDVFDRLFDDRFLLEPFDFFRTAPRMMGQLGRNMFPKVDVSETDKEVKVIADVPGVDPEDIDIDVHDNRMVISGVTERETETDKNTKPYRYERSYGEFRREFMLPSRVNEDQIKAKCKDGVLTITLPKVEGEKKSKIKIEKQ